MSSKVQILARISWLYEIECCEVCVVVGDGTGVVKMEPVDGIDQERPAGRRYLCCHDSNGSMSQLTDHRAQDRESAWQKSFR